MVYQTSSLQQGEEASMHLLRMCIHHSIDFNIEELYSQVCVWRPVDANYIAAGYK